MSPAMSRRMASPSAERVTRSGRVTTRRQRKPTTAASASRTNTSFTNPYARPSGAAGSRSGR